MVSSAASILAIDGTVGTAVDPPGATWTWALYSTIKASKAVFNSENLTAEDAAPFILTSPAFILIVPLKLL